MSNSIQTHTISRLCRFIGLIIIVVLEGCSTNVINVDTQLNANAKVGIQFCLPDKRIYFNDLVLDRLENHPLFTKYSEQQLELAPRTIRRVAGSSDSRSIQTYGISFGEVLIQNGLFSSSIGFMPIHDSTVANQPVYGLEHGHPARNYVAIRVLLPETEIGKEGRVTYWFVLPKSIPSDGFTDWLKPISMEPEDERPQLWWKLTHGGAMTIYSVSVDSPKMRVSLTQQHNKHDDPTVDTLPALTTARIKYKTPTSDQQFVYQFVPKSAEAIPACN